MTHRNLARCFGWLALAAWIPCNPAYAIDSAAEVGPAAPARTTLAEVVVTGSRIPLASGTETLPVTVLDATDLARGGLDSLSKILQSLPMSAASVANTNVNNGGDGSARLDLRALQPKRTLVLLNGHRFPNGGIGGDASVDLNSLPVSLIDRVEVLTSGASAIYGADAVAGVVNFVTRAAVSGIEVTGAQSRADRGDGRVSSVTLSAGRELFGGQWMLGADYVDQRGVTQAAREYSAQPKTIVDFNGTTIPSGRPTLPEGLFGVPGGNALGLAPGPYTRVSGMTGRSAANYRPWQFDGDVFNVAPYSYSQTPNERGTLWLLGTQPLGSDLSLHVEGLWHHRRSAQQLAPVPYATRFDPAPLLADGSTGIPADNYYNPFGVDLNRVNRRFVELPNRGYRQSVDMNRVLVALRGVRGSWSFEAAGALAYSSASKSDLGAIPGQRLVRAVGPSGPDAQGHIVCGTPDPQNGIVPANAILADCVPIDLFGGVGSLTAEQRAYLVAPLQDHGTQSEHWASVDAEGPWGTAPGGPILWAAGAEYRRETGSYRFDPLRGGGAISSGGDSDLPKVSFAARELYVEVRAPLARGRRFAQALDAAAGLRWSEFSSFGGHFTWQSSLRWQPVASWALRSSYARVFRAPNLRELYQRQSVGASDAFDPCGNHPTAEQRVHCAANGVPGGEYVQSPVSSFNTVDGGNPQLAPEHGYSFDIGLDLRPTAWSGLHATLDLYQIDLSGYIENPSEDNLLGECANRGRADVCALIQRDTDGSVIAMTLTPRNFGRSVVSGIDGSVSMSRERRIGRLTLALQGSYLARHDIEPFPGGTILRQAGTYSGFSAALPRWRTLAHLDIERGVWNGSYSLQWIGGYQECGELEDGHYCRAVGRVLYHDIEASLRLGSALTLRVGVTNLTDRQPPFVNFGFDANTDPATYRLLGRTLFAAFRYAMH